MFDLGGHVLDQVVWILGRPNRVTGFLQHAASEAPGVMDNTLGVLEYDNAIATVDIAAMEPRPMARRFEVYGTKGSAIMEPYEPAETIRLTLENDQGEYKKGVNIVQLEDRPRYVGTFASSSATSVANQSHSARSITNCWYRKP